MRFVQALVFLCVLSMGLAVVARPAQSQAGGAGAAHAQQKMQRQQIRDKAEVNRLKRDVHRQEWESKRASERLQQQDKAIAELEKQLQQLQPSPSVGQPQHVMLR